MVRLLSLFRGTHNQRSPSSQPRRPLYHMFHQHHEPPLASTMQQNPRVVQPLQHQVKPTFCRRLLSAITFSKSRNNANKKSRAEVDLEEKLVHVQKRLEGVQQAKTAAKYREEAFCECITSLKAENEQLEHDAAQMEFDYVDLEMDKSRVEMELQHLHAEYREQTELMQGDLRELVRAMFGRILSGDLEETKHGLETTKNALDETTSVLHSTFKALKQRDKELAKYKNELKLIRNAEKASADKIRELNTLMASKQADLETKQEKCERHKDQKKQMKIKIDTLTEKLEKTKASFNDLKTSVYDHLQHLRAESGHVGNGGVPADTEAGVSSKASSISATIPAPESSSSLAIGVSETSATDAHSSLTSPSSKGFLAKVNNVSGINSTIDLDAILQDEKNFLPESNPLPLAYKASYFEGELYGKDIEAIARLLKDPAAFIDKGKYTCHTWQGRELRDSLIKTKSWAADLFFQAEQTVNQLVVENEGFTRQIDELKYHSAELTAQLVNLHRHFSHDHNMQRIYDLEEALARAQKENFILQDITNAKSYVEECRRLEKSLDVKDAELEQVSIELANKTSELDSLRYSYNLVVDQLTQSAPSTSGILKDATEDPASPHNRVETEGEPMDIDEDMSVLPERHSFNGPTGTIQRSDGIHVFDGDNDLAAGAGNTVQLSATRNGSIDEEKENRGHIGARQAKSTLKKPSNQSEVVLAERSGGGNALKPSAPSERTVYKQPTTDFETQPADLAQQRTLDTQVIAPLRHLPVAPDAGSIEPSNATPTKMVDAAPALDRTFGVSTSTADGENRISLRVYDLPGPRDALTSEGPKSKKQARKERNKKREDKTKKN